jgi:hypothetical protein
VRRRGHPHLDAELRRLALEPVVAVPVGPRDHQHPALGVLDDLVGARHDRHEVVDRLVGVDDRGVLDRLAVQGLRIEVDPVVGAPQATGTRRARTRRGGALHGRRRIPHRRVIAPSPTGNSKVYNAAVSSPPIPRPTRRLQAARLAGLAAISLLGMVVANAPERHFGAASQITLVGAIYAITLLVLVGGRRHWVVLLGRRWGAWGTPALLSLNILAFLPALIEDLPIAGGVVLWSFVLLAYHVAPTPRASVRARREAGPPEAEAVWMQNYGDATRHLLLVSLFVSLSVVGFQVASSWLADLICVILGLALALLSRAVHDRGDPPPPAVPPAARRGPAGPAARGQPDERRCSSRSRCTS